MCQNMPGYSLVSTSPLHPISSEMELLAQLNRSITPNTDTSHSPMAMDWFDALSLGGGVPKLSVDGQYVKQRIWQK